MAEEKEVKKTTTRKPRTPKTEVQESVEPSIQDQMNAMMQMMAQQQQMFAMMMQQMQQPKGVAEKVEDVKEEPKQQKIRPAKREKTGKVTKQQLRRKYKDVEIYLINVTTGTVGYQGKHEYYAWDDTGESVPVAIDDLIAMNDFFLQTCKLTLDEYENEPEVLDDIIQCLELQEAYDYLYLLNDLDEDIENVSPKRVKEVVNSENGRSLRADIATLVQQKIEKEELTNGKLIKQYEEILHMNFKK